MKKTIIGGLCLLVFEASMYMNFTPGREITQEGLLTRLRDEGYNEAQQLILMYRPTPSTVARPFETTASRFDEDTRNPGGVYNAVLAYLQELARNCDIETYKKVQKYNDFMTPSDKFGLAHSVLYNVFHHKYGATEFVSLKNIKELLGIIIHEQVNITAPLASIHVSLSKGIDIQGTILDNFLDHLLQRYYGFSLGEALDVESEKEIKERAIEIYKYLVNEKGAKHSPKWKELWRQRGGNPIENMRRIYAEMVQAKKAVEPLDRLKKLWDDPDLEELCKWGMAQ